MTYVDSERTQALNCCIRVSADLYAPNPFVCTYIPAGYRYGTAVTIGEECQRDTVSRLS